MAGTGQAPMFQPIGGIDNFPKGFQRALGDKIALGAEVQSIQQSRATCKVVCKNLKTGQIQEITADYVVSCLPLTVLSTTGRQPLRRDDGRGEGHAATARARRWGCR